MKLLEYAKAQISYIRNKLLNKEVYIYVAIGDSTVEGVGASHSSKTYPSVITNAIKQVRKNVILHNLGVAGAKTHDVIQDQLDQAVALQPNLVTISIGANDIFKRVSTKRFTENLTMILSTLSSQTDATIVINTIPDFAPVTKIPPVLKHYVQMRTKKFNTIIHTLAEQYEIVYIDLHPHIKLLGRDYPHFVSNDGLHPSDTGYAFWAHLILANTRHLL